MEIHCPIMEIRSNLNSIDFYFPAYNVLFNVPRNKFLIDIINALDFLIIKRYIEP